MTLIKHPLFLLFCLSLPLLGCGGTASHSVSAPQAEMASLKKSDQRNEAIMAVGGAQKAIQEDYQIGSEDLLEIEAYNVEELKKTVRVNTEGNIALPLVGVLNVKGLTTAETEKLITKKLEKYVEETVVTVFVKEYKSQRISVVGAVNTPQVFAVTGQRYLLDMLMMAGGLSKEAGSVSYVIRPTTKSSQGSTASTIVIDMDELLNNGNFSLNIPVFAGDVINVPKGGVVFVDGSVRMPGAYSMKSRSSTLSQAIAMAQGVNQDADLSDVRIFRDSGKPDRDVIAADYESIRKGEKPDIALAENDIIVVPQSGVKNFFNVFIKVLTGFVSFGAPLY